MKTKMLSLLLAVMVPLGLVVMPASANVQEPDASTPAWLEPNGLNIIDLVGAVPETYLQNAIIFNEVGLGIIQYRSGSRAGNTVKLHTTIHPRYFAWEGIQYSQFGCLGQSPQLDNWGTVAPAARMRVYAGSQDVTGGILIQNLFVAGQVQPVHNAVDPVLNRYQDAPPPTRFEDGWALIPANRGCLIRVPGFQSNMTADFVVEAAPEIRVTLVGHQDFAFHSYIGVGAIGWFESLRQQLRQKYGERHEKLPLTIPADANYLFVNFPPTPVDLYTGPAEHNVDQPAGGTYRLKAKTGQLSVDHVVAMGIPWQGQWQDADLAPGSTYLPYLRNNNYLAVPEYFVPPGVPYQPCMTAGGCPDALLSQIYNTTTTLGVTYLKVEQIAPGLKRIPLRMVGPNWTPGAVAATPPGSTVSPAPGASALNRTIHLPIAVNGQPGFPVDDTKGCPCGWFNADGRMLDFTAAP
jgi:hypothetical protein